SSAAIRQTGSALSSCCRKGQRLKHVSWARSERTWPISFGNGLLARGRVRALFRTVNKGCARSCWVAPTPSRQIDFVQIPVEFASLLNDQLVPRSLGISPGREVFSQKEVARDGFAGAFVRHGNFAYRLDLLLRELNRLPVMRVPVEQSPRFFGPPLRIPSF